MADKNYSLLLREAALRLTLTQQPRKRRKRRIGDVSPKLAGPVDVVTESPSELDVEKNTPDAENYTEMDTKANSQPEFRLNSGSDSDEDSHSGPNSDSDMDSDDFEDVEIGSVAPPPRGPSDSITITIHQAKKEVRKKVVISREERAQRLILHRWILVALLCHGVVRNLWCNDRVLLRNMRRTVPQSITALLDQLDNTALSMVKARRFLDGVRNLMLTYSRKFSVTKRGLVRKNWGELSEVQKKFERNMTLSRFRNLVLEQAGSRDLGAQGFVSLLRSLGLNARLVFSLQPPDWTSLAMVKPTLAKEEREQEAQPKTGTQAGANLPPSSDTEHNTSSKSKFLAAQRQQQTFFESESTHFDQSAFPIFWAEVWNKYLKKWVSVDPITLKSVEVAPMRRASQFQPPSSDTRNQMTYVVAYDQLGGVKDVTRRYSFHFNAKTSRKRIQSRSDEDAIWYSRVLRQANSMLRRDNVTSTDAHELKEFHDRDKAEGMPSSLSDFKNHPLFALKSQLRLNEVVFPDDASSKVGTFRSRTRKNASTMVVYKRAHVYHLRSARGWYMRGRVLKVGAQALKVKTTKNAEEEEEEDGRLYAQFQTSMYSPPAIVDGKVPKNAFGNIDVYVPSMLPENGFLLRADKTTPLKILERAARIVEVDYARAIVSFEFGKGSKATAKEGGIVFDVQYRGAIELVLSHLLDQEREKLEHMVEVIALRNWKYFLTRLRISERLIREHGTVRESKEVERTGGGGFEVGGGFAADEYGSESESEGMGIFEPGGFEHEASRFEPGEVGAGEFDSEEAGAGGFEPEDPIVPGGFEVPSDSRAQSAYTERHDKAIEDDHVSIADESLDDSISRQPTEIEGKQSSTDSDIRMITPQNNVEDHKATTIRVDTSSDESDIDLSPTSDRNRRLVAPKFSPRQKFLTGRDVTAAKSLPAKHQNSTSKANALQIKTARRETPGDDDGISEIPADFFHTDPSGHLVYLPGSGEAQNNSDYPKEQTSTLYAGNTLSPSKVQSFPSLSSGEDEYGFEFESE